MSSHTVDLAVRGHERYQCDQAAELAVAIEHARAVKPDKSAPGAGGPVAVRAVDVSMGGVGFRSPLFFPITCKLNLTMHMPGVDAPLTLPLRIQRVMMLDHAPTYYLGTSLDGASSEQLKSLELMLSYLKSTGAAVVPEKPRA